MNTLSLPGNRFSSFSEVFAPRGLGIQSGLWVLGASLLIALCAQITIPLPFTPVPLAGSTFGVLYAAALLGSRRGVASVATYLTLGAIGFPFFAGAASGWHIFFGATGGYLIGFLPAAWLVGFLSEHGWDRDPMTAFFQMILGSFVILAFGLVVLSVFVPKGHLLEMGFYPFVIGDILKSCLAAGLLPFGWRLARKQ